MRKDLTVLTQGDKWFGHCEELADKFGQRMTPQDPHKFFNKKGEANEKTSRRS